MIPLETIIWCVLWLIIGGLVFWLLDWLIVYVGVPEPFHKVCRVILAVGAVFWVIAVLFQLAGKPLVRWGP